MINAMPSYMALELIRKFGCDRETVPSIRGWHKEFSDRYSMAFARSQTSFTVFGLICVAIGMMSCQSNENALTHSSESESQNTAHGSLIPEDAKMQSNNMLVEYTITGGMPPASFESLRISSDGSVRSLVGNAWAEGVQQNEAGVYETRLEKEDSRSLRELISAADPGSSENTYGKAYPGSAQEKLTFIVGERQRTIQWTMGSELPQDLTTLRNHLNQTLASSKKFPQSVIRLQVALDASEFELGNRLQFQGSLVNPGTDSVTIKVTDPEGHSPLPALRYLVKPWNEFDEQVVPLIEVFEAGKGLTLDDIGLERSSNDKLILAPGASSTFSVQVDPNIQNKGTYNLFVMFELLIAVNWDGQVSDSYSVMVVPPIKLLAIDTADKQ